MYQKLSHDLVISKDKRSTQSAHKYRSRDSPYKLYQNLTHKNSNQSKDIDLLQNNQNKPRHYLQTSIDVHELNRSQKSQHSYSRIKTEIDKSIDLNKRIQPKIRLKYKEIINMLQIRFQQVRQINFGHLNQIKEVQRDMQEIQDSHNKYFFKSDIKQSLSVKANNYLKINSQVINNQDSTEDDLSQIDNQQYIVNELRRNANPNQLKKSIFQQIQDFNLIKFNQIHLSKEEDYMKFSFGFQYNQVKSTKKFPKDVFYNDVRKAKKNLSIQ